MNVRIAALLVWAAAASVQAQPELPNTWLTQQIQAARQDARALQTNNSATAPTAAARATALAALAAAAPSSAAADAASRRQATAAMPGLALRK